MLEVEEAQDRIASAIEPLGAERIPLPESPGRIVAEDLKAAVDLPPFDNSAMDGYAVRAEDVASANADQPVMLKLAGQAAAGSVPSQTVLPGTCVRVFTGSPLPQGADAVVMQEDTEPAQPDVISFLDGAKPWENVRLRGEDVKKGEALTRTGQRLSTGRAALLAATGVSEIAVGRRPLVGLVATGTELREAGQPLEPGQIYESNRISLAALVRSSGGLACSYPLVKDSLQETQRTLRLALDECDIVITSGGVSVGELDFVRQAFQDIGGELGFWKIAMRPGKPFAFGRWQKKFLFALPGNPVSSFVTYLLLVRPALLRLQGAADRKLPVRLGTLAERLANRGDRRHFLRVVVDQQGNVRSAGVQGSHVMSSLAEANGLVDIPPHETIEAGKVVPVLFWE